MDEAFIQKRQDLRTELWALRRGLKKPRREEAERSALLLLESMLPSEGLVLSYDSFGHEFPTRKVNELLAKRGQLALPRVEGLELGVYQVGDTAAELENSSLGMREPIPEKTYSIDIQTLKLVLVPALGFDRSLHRIGYGKGFYDRFLEKIPQIADIGLGFSEQLVEGSLPIAPHDLQLSGLLLL